MFQGGAKPGCVAAVNVDGVGTVNITDPIVLLAHLFLGGDPPIEPFPGCGPGNFQADEDVGCEAPPANCQ
jgi:hypothetical protein